MTYNDTLLQVPIIVDY